MATHTRPLIHLRDYGAELDLPLGIADTFNLNMSGRTYVSMRLAIFEDGFGPILRELPEDDPKRVMYEYVMESYNPNITHDLESSTDPLPQAVYIEHQKVDDNGTPDDPSDDTVIASREEYFYVGRSNFHFKMFYKETPRDYLPYDSLPKKDDIILVRGEHAVRVDPGQVPSIEEYKNDFSLVPTADDLYPAEGPPQI